MPVPCPCCKASNDAGPLCRRCKADLSLLLAVEGERMTLVADAAALASESRYPEARSVLDRAAELRRGVDISRARAAISLLDRDFTGALSAYHEVVGLPGRRPG